jgi:histone H3/H4
MARTKLNVSPKSTKAPKAVKTIARPPGLKPKDKPHRWKPGTAAGFRVRRLRKRIKPLIKRAPLERLIRYIHGVNGRQWRMSYKTVEVVQEYVDAMLHRALMAAQTQQIRQKKQTLDVGMVLDGLMEVTKEFQNNVLANAISNMPQELAPLADALESDPVWSKLYAPTIAHAKKKND